MADTTIDIDSIKRELKAWERKFKQENGTDKITKEDMKAHPEIDAKYKLWRDLSKPSTQSATVKKVPAPKPHEPPSTPSRATTTTRKPTKPTTATATSSSIFQKASATKSTKLPTTSNPFSPTKGKTQVSGKDEEEDEDAPPRTVRKFAFDDNPFLISRTPETSASGSSSSATVSADLPNPFATSPAKSKRSIFATPVKATTPFTSLGRSAGNLFSTRDVTASPGAAGDYAYADSPKKLKALIQSTSAALKDTPRTKSRKRLRGEEVIATPGDKRRRMAALESNGEGGDEDDDEEGMEFSPVKPTAGAGMKGKTFRPVFEDAEEEEKASFFSKPPRAGGMSRALSRAPSLFASADSSHETARDKNAGKDKKKKRSSDEMDYSITRLDSVAEDAADASAQIPVVPVSQMNVHGLRPPSPVLSQAGKGKEKVKWGSRKKEKVDVQMDLAEEAGGNDANEEDDLEAADVIPAMLASGQPYVRMDALAPGKESDPDDARPIDEPEARFHLNAQAKHRVQPSDGEDGDDAGDEEDENLHVDLPSTMQRVLNIESPSKHRAPAEDVAQDLLRGVRQPKVMKGREVWGVGDLERRDLEEAEDWESEPDGWTGGVEM